MHAGAEAEANPDRGLVLDSGRPESRGMSGVSQGTAPEHCSSLIALIKVGMLPSQFLAPVTFTKLVFCMTRRKE